MLNQTVVVGNLGQDHETYYSAEGNPVASFNLAFRVAKKKTGWIKVVCFNSLAEIAEKHLHKGARIALIGG
ncbi:MAG: single-stranded DNA-binding protein [Desulfobacterota bacterium]|jgi:single-strand DNA-binding protein|nr:single-stranded DNA-binding protein [Thermodesulfobacteriota bacterium]